MTEGTPEQPVEHRPKEIEAILSSAWTAPQRGDRLGDRFTLLAERGKGAYGVVWKAHDVVDDTEVAVKIFKPDKVKDPSAFADAAARFYNGVSAMSRIGKAGKVPTIMKVVSGPSTTPPYLWFAMPLAAESLAEAIEKGYLTAEAKISIVSDVVDAIQAAHKRGILHRDICPENVLLFTDEKGAAVPRAVLSDFDIAYLAQGPVRKRTTTSIEGHYYLPPEIYRSGAAGKDLAKLYRRPENDVWALGRLVFDLFAKRTETGEFVSLPQDTRSVKDFLSCFPQSNDPDHAQDLRARRAAAEFCESLLSLERQTRVISIERAHHLWLRATGRTTGSSIGSALVTALALANFAAALDWLAGRPPLDAGAQIATKVVSAVLSLGALGTLANWVHKTAIQSKSRGRLALDFALSRIPGGHASTVVALAFALASVLYVTEFHKRVSSAWVTNGTGCVPLRTDGGSGPPIDSSGAAAVSFGKQFATIRCPQGSTAKLLGRSWLTPVPPIEYSDQASAHAAHADKPAPPPAPVFHRKMISQSLQLTIGFAEPVPLRGRDDTVRNHIYQSHVNAVESCYRRNHAANGAFRAGATVTLDVDGLGEVTKARVQSDTVPDKTLDACLTAAFEKWRFSETQEDYTVTCQVAYRPLAVLQHAGARVDKTPVRATSSF